MNKNTFNKEDIIASIVKTFGSVEKYAIFKGRKKQTIYGRLDNLTNKFLQELEEDGIQINNVTGTLDLTQIKEDMTKLKADMYDLQHEIKNKDERINELEAENDQLRVEVAALLAKYKPKLKR